MRGWQGPGLAAVLLLVLAAATASAEDSRAVKLPDPEGAESVRALTKEGKHAEAEQAAREILARVVATEGERSLPAAKATDLLLETLWRGGKAGEPEMLELAKLTLELKRELLDAQHIETASGLYKLAALLNYRGRYAEARPLFEERLAMIEAIVAPADPRLAKSVTDVANLLTTLAEYDAARPLYERALSIMQAAFGPDSPELAPHLYNVGRIHRLLGRFDDAEVFLQKALNNREVSIGPDDVGLAPYLNGLAALFEQTGDWVDSRRYFERALAIRRKSLGPDHLDVAGSLNNLAHFLRRTGDFESARRLFEQALAIREKGLPPTSDLIGQSLHNLAIVLAKLDERKLAVERFERALAIQVEAYGLVHAVVATTLTDYGDFLVAVGDHDRAREKYERALGIRKEVFDPGHPDLASCHDGLGVVLLRSGDLERAREHLERALSIREQAFGPAHPRVADVLEHYAELWQSLGNHAKALEHGLRAESVSRDHLMLTARTLPERQALRYAEHRPRGLSLALSIAAESAVSQTTEQVWDALIRSRALVLDEMAARSRAVSREADPGLIPFVEELTLASRELADLTVQGIQTGDVAGFRERLDEARSRKEQAERALAEQSVAFREELRSRQVGLDDVEKALPANSALVAYAQYGTPPSYLALVRRSDRQRVVVDLGKAKRIDRLVAHWKTEVSRGVMKWRKAETIDRAYRLAGTELRKAVWDPLATQLKNAKQIFVVPDGALQLVSFAALPLSDGRYLVESGPLVHYLSAERDIVAYAGERRHGSGLLAFGGPDFGDTTPMGFGKLPATVREVKEIAGMFPGGAAPLIGANASEQAFKEQAPGRRILHVATHGFFLGDRRRSSSMNTRAVGGLSKEPSDADKQTENPLMLSGLALAGANRSGQTGPFGEDGILTAHEIAAMDLSSVEWAVLSACDTGVGEIKAGEGVFGLRRAFRVAGASTVIMSLWEVEDDSTRRWMRALYENRLQHGRSTAEAVHHASLTMLRQRREANAGTHPFYWAGFVAAGDWH